MKTIKLLIDITQKRLWKVKRVFVIDAIIKTIEIMVEIGRISNNVLVSVKMTDDKEIKKINNDFRDKNKPTNVLSFQSIDWTSNELDLIDLRFISRSNNLYICNISESGSWTDKQKIEEGGSVINIGDIVLSYETIYSEAIEQKKIFDQYLQFMTIHGILHLMGYDHEEENDAEIMSEKEYEIMQKLMR